MQSKSKFSLTNIAKEDYFIASPYLITNVIKKLESDWYDINNYFGKPLYPPPLITLNSPLTNPLTNPENMYKIIENNFQKKIRKEIQKDSSILRQEQTEGSLNKEYTVKKIETAKLSNEEKYILFKDRVCKAIKKKEIFILNGNYSVIRHALISRGWVEKLNRNTLSKLQNETIESLIKYAANNNDYERVVLSKMIDTTLANFVCGGVRPIQSNAFPFYNRVTMLDKRCDFTNKEGLIECVKRTMTKNGLTDVRTPPFHHLYQEENMDFLRDYRTIYCLTLLLHIAKSPNMINIFRTTGTISLQVLTMATDRIRYEINYRKSNSNLSRINRILKDDHCVPCKRWDNFYTSTNLIISGGATFLCNNNNRFSNIARKIKLKQITDLVEEAKLFWPLLPAYGLNNLWILKPGHSCQGKGICIKRNYIDILNYVRHRKNKHYVVQKYLEKPLLIYKTKFDIRQHMLISITETKLNVWMYRDCYLRFASHEYQTRNLHKAIHLTNYSVQKKFKNGKRNSKLPPHNMWSLNEFKQYLDEHNKKDLWNDKIYPDIKAMIISIVSNNLYNINYIPHTFEIYGCDFMLDECLRPILLEINGNPDMTPSTIITKTLCADVLRDAIKVVIDLPYYSTFSTGDFELVYDYDYTNLKI